jgi:hypothetical protein
MFFCGSEFVPPGRLSGNTALFRVLRHPPVRVVVALETVSGAAPIHPVVTKSGHVYEKELIEKYIGGSEMGGRM